MLNGRLHNSIDPAILTRLVRKEPWGSELSRLCYVAFLFMLRLPSEALPLTRALPNDRLLSPDRASSHAVIGLREFHGEQRIALKLAKRKNARNAFIATRPCFCANNALPPKNNCPIRRFWKAVPGHTEPGSLLSP